MEAAAPPRGRIVLGDNLDVLRALPDGLARLVYVDPPFNTGGEQRRTRLRTVRDDAGDRTGFQGRRYRTEVLGSTAWPDVHDDYLGFLGAAPRGGAARPGADGSLFFHIDPREAHYCKVLLDGIFGRASFVNEIVWAYDYGGRSKTALAGQARRHLLVRARPQALRVPLRRDRPRAVHGARTRRAPRRRRAARPRPTSGGTRS